VGWVVGVVIVFLILLFLYGCVWVSRMAEDVEKSDGRWRL
jgi:Na+-transporting methylmalonyl-CoA/oxaloacetate decarboxylase gamma subunit